MSNNFEIIITPEAESDLDKIWLYGFETWSEKQADIYLEKLVKKINSLEIFPNRGVKHEEYGDNIRVLYDNPHLIIYTLDAKIVTIIRILDGRSDLYSILI
jgi:toxin ParE1/3/4